jgi:hypothetical protein
MSLEMYVLLIVIIPALPVGIILDFDYELDIYNSSQLYISGSIDIHYPTLYASIISQMSVLLHQKILWIHYHRTHDRHVYNRDTRGDCSTITTGVYHTGARYCTTQ